MKPFYIYMVLVTILSTFVIYVMYLQAQECKKYWTICQDALEVCFNSTKASIIDCKVCAMCQVFCHGSGTGLWDRIEQVRYK